MAIRINLKDATVELGGNFNSALRFVKGFSGRKYDPTTKTWTVPTTISEFQKFNTFPTEIISGNGGNRYASGNHVTKFGNAYSRDEWDATQEAWSAKAEIASSTAKHEVALDSQVREKLSAIGLSDNAVSLLASKPFDIEEMEEAGRIRFSSDERRAEIYAIIEWFRSEKVRVWQEEDNAVEAANERIWSKYDFE
jgi:hypothetical protein